MERRIPAFDARRQLGKLLQNVTAKGETYVVERHDKRVAAMVPIEVYEEWKQQRSAFFDRWRQAAERVDLTLDEAEKLANEAVQAARRDLRP